MFNGIQAETYRLADDPNTVMNFSNEGELSPQDKISAGKNGGCRPVVVYNVSPLFSIEFEIKE